MSANWLDRTSPLRQRQQKTSQRRKQKHDCFYASGKAIDHPHEYTSASREQRDVFFSILITAGWWIICWQQGRGIRCYSFDEDAVKYDRLFHYSVAVATHVQHRLAIRDARV